MIKSIKKISRKHYIQCGLAVLLTGLVLYFTSAWWSDKAFIVSFNTKLTKGINYQVFYTQSKGENFTGQQVVTKSIRSGNQSVEIMLPIEKIVRFRLDVGVNPGDIEISDLRIRGSQNMKFDYSEFNKNQIDKYEVKDGKLYITSNKGDPYLAYKPELNLPAGMQIDWCRLVIISVLAFLLMYKFVQYLSKFKIEKQHSRIDIVMLAVFFALLFVPMSHISDAEKSEQENRVLAKKPQLAIDDKDIGNIGVQFDAWYNDHFFGRDTMMWLYNYIKYKISPMAGNNKVLVGKAGWWFLKNNESLDDLINKTVLNDKKMKQGLEYLIKIDEWCKKHNKKFYYLIAPDKHVIYGEYMNKIKKINTDSYSIGSQFYKFVKDNSDIQIVYPADELIANKDKGFLYYKQDNHWTALGAYYGTAELLALMNRNLSEYKFNNSERDWNELYRMYPIGSLNNIKYPDISSEQTEFFCNDYRGEQDVKCINKKGTGKILVYRDSFAKKMLPYLLSDFNIVYMYWRYGITEKDLKFITDNNIDTIVLENVERRMNVIFNQKFPNLSKEN